MAGPPFYSDLVDIAAAAALDDDPISLVELNDVAENIVGGRG